MLLSILSHPKVASCMTDCIILQRTTKKKKWQTVLSYRQRKVRIEREKKQKSEEGHKNNCLMAYK